jgi:hypothetical protein
MVCGSVPSLQLQPQGERLHESPCRVRAGGNHCQDFMS